MMIFRKRKGGTGGIAEVKLWVQSSVLKKISVFILFLAFVHFFPVSFYLVFISMGMSFALSTYRVPCKQKSLNRCWINKYPWEIISL
jgi:hypothetical protein